jgi:hypothetical protein
MQTGTLVDHWSDCGALIVVSVTDVSLRIGSFAESMPIAKLLFLLWWDLRCLTGLLLAWADALFLCIDQGVSCAFIFAELLSKPGHWWHGLRAIYYQGRSFSPPSHHSKIRD